MVINKAAVSVSNCFVEKYHTEKKTYGERAEDVLFLFQNMTGSFSEQVKAEQIKQAGNRRRM